MRFYRGDFTLNAVLATLAVIFDTNFAKNAKSKKGLKIAFFTKIHAKMQKFCDIILFMSKKEVIKTHITTIQALIIAFLSAIFAVFGYVIIHIDDEISKLKIIFGSIAFALLILGLILLVFAYFKLIKNIKDIQ